MRKVFKYKKAMRVRIQEEIKLLLQQGQDYEEIAKKLNQMGFKAPNGEPMTYQTVAVQVGNIRYNDRILNDARVESAAKRGSIYVGSKQTTFATRENDLIESLTMISKIISSQKSPAQKLDLIRAWVS